MSVHDGGSAFPSPKMKYNIKNNEYTEQNGMTLRDYFAAKAMQSIIALNGRNISPQASAGQAYEAADAMLKARETQR